MLVSITQAALDLVFPALCPVCLATLGGDRRDPLCGPCWHAITRLGRPRCHVCGAAPPLAVMSPVIDRPSLEIVPVNG